MYISNRNLNGLRFKKKRHCVYFVYENGKVIGSAGIRHYKKRIAIITHLYTEERLKDVVTEMLLKKLEATARRWKCLSVIIDVDSDSKEFFRNHGYVIRFSPDKDYKAKIQGAYVEAEAYLKKFSFR